MLTQSVSYQISPFMLPAQHHVTPAPSSRALFIFRSVLCASHSKALTVIRTRLYITLNRCRHLECSLVAVSNFIIRSEVPFGPELSKQKVRHIFHASQILGVTRTDSGSMSTLCPGFSKHRCHVFIAINNESECTYHYCVWAFGIPHLHLLGTCP